MVGNLNISIIANYINCHFPGSYKQRFRRGGAMPLPQSNNYGNAGISGIVTYFTDFFRSIIATARAGRCPAPTNMLFVNCPSNWNWTQKGSRGSGAFYTIIYTGSDCRQRRTVALPGLLLRFPARIPPGPSQHRAVWDCPSRGAVNSRLFPNGARNTAVHPA